MTLARKFLFVYLFLSNISFAREYFIFSVEHDLPMGIEEEVLRKNYFINIGEKQGVTVGTTLDVFRTINQNDPYETKKRYSYDIKVGELEVIHQDRDASIAVSKNIREGQRVPILEVPNFMVGDAVKLKLAQ
ncbi:hypothetical protein [Bacteriovorax sp. Seq25_V]|uniref:hypothetical protein n=1 Tax=Bacteriovorax sp. Seq25_V TaxID=1201288 RepID=UPI00038A1EEF|nr:hypothetical protein [Bacteriovorax sp. Seq25_V]EQC43449.1 hypothetical protein M900_0216 [Bacteriovorax sp. Seq25_V]